MNAVLSDGIILNAQGKPAWIDALNNQWYEGSRWSPNRSHIWQPVQDAKRDLDRYTRYELTRHARYLYKNSPLIRGIIERLVTITVGCGFYPVPKSSNPDWNTRFNAWWKKRSRSIHLGPKCSFSQYQRAVVRARFLDGECFSIKTFDQSVSFTDMIQGIEADRVTGFGLGSAGQPTSDGGILVDGFNLNEQGIVQSYNLRGVKNPYSSSDVVHHFTPGRLGQYRGETILAAAINTARDVDDILALEKQCVKDASGKKDVIKTASGQLDAETFRSLRYGSGSQSGQFPTVFNLPADDKTKNDYYRMQFGAESVVLKRGDEYTPLQPLRPGGAWQGFMAFLANTICTSTNLPPSVAIPADVGGTDIRRDLEIAQRVVEPWQLDVVCELDEIIDYLVEGEVIDGALKKDAPEDWNVRNWQMPQKLTVDRNQAQQDRADVAAGLMSLEEYHGRYGDNAETVETSIIEEAKRRKASIQTAGFKDVKEFVQIISLAPTMFQSKEETKTEPVTA